MSIRRIFIIAGDASGDLHGSFVIRRLQEEMPEVEIQAIGGENIESTGVKLFYHQQKLGVFGMGVISAIPSHYLLGKRIIKHFHSWRPDTVLFIDYGMFNLWMASQLKGSGVKLFYYIPPQIWASRRGRINRIKRYIDHVFGIFPFEEEIYRSHSVPFTFVGHPLIEQLPPPPDRESFYREHNLDPNLDIIGIFPGSRRLELKNLLEPMIAAMPLIEEMSGKRFHFLLARSSALPNDLFNRMIEPLRPYTERVSFGVLSHQNREILALSSAALVASGTVTLEAALYNRPVVIAYKISRFSFEIFRRFVYVSHIGLPNLLSDNAKGFLPELLMEKVRPEELAKSILPYLSDTTERREAEQQFRRIREKLGNESASSNVVKALSRF